MKRISLVVSVLLGATAIAAEDRWQKRVTLEARQMQAATVLQKLGEQGQFDLLLDPEFPREEAITVDAKNFPVGKFLDVVGKSTKRKWKGEVIGGRTFVRFEKEE